MQQQQHTSAQIDRFVCALKFPVTAFDLSVNRTFGSHSLV